MNGINLQQIPVGLSDFLLCAISLMVYLGFKRLWSTNPVFHLWCWYFLGVSWISCFGGIYHLLTPGILKPPLSTILWNVILWLLGGVSLIGWRLYFLMGWRTEINRGYRILELVILMIYSLMIFNNPSFFVASLFVGCMAIAHVFLGVIQCMHGFRFPWFCYLLGWIAYLIGAIIQFLAISWDSMSLSHNTLYHLMSALAILINYLSIKKIFIE